MKIAHLIPTFSPFGGSGRAIYMVATEQKDAGNDVTLFALEADRRLTINVALEIMGGKEALQAFTILNIKYSNLEMVIRAKLPSHIRSKYAGLTNLKVVEEILPWQLLEQEFKQADIFIFPSHLLHNTVVLEAMSYELPVVTTYIGASGGEYMEDSITGFVAASPEKMPYFLDNFILTSETIHRNWLVKSSQSVDPKVVDELVTKTGLLIENPDLRRKMGKAARWEVDHGRFSIEKRNERLKRIFDEAVRA
jgi:glycosyltransferase involved in cell wall biosynthesis